MKKLIINLIIIFTISIAISSNLNAQINETFIGKWNFECLLAPAGFNEGTIEIQKDSVFTQYSGRDYRFSSLWVKMENDTLIFKVDINGERVVCRLSVDGNKLAGIADTMEDESPLILTKKEDVPYYFARD